MTYDKFLNIPVSVLKDLEIILLLKSKYQMEITSHERELYETLKELSDYLNYEKLPLSVAKKLDLYLKTPNELAQEHLNSVP